MSTKLQGLIGLTSAIHYFSCLGYIVSIPLNDSQKYDLIVDTGEGLKKVSVKTTSQRNRNGGFEVQISAKGGNRSRNSIAPFDNKSCDLVYVLTSERKAYLFESSSITARHHFTITEDRKAHRVHTEEYLGRSRGL